MIVDRQRIPIVTLLQAVCTALTVSPPIHAQTQPITKVVVQGASSCSKCRVQRTPIVAIKDTEHLLLPNEASLVVDARGRVYAQDVQTKAFFSFDAQGKRIGRVGGIGAGPGEFKGTVSAKVDRFDSLWVSNPGQSRVSIFAPSSRAHVRDVVTEARIGIRGGDWLLLDRSQLLVSSPFAPNAADRLVLFGEDGRITKKLGADAELRVRSATVAPSRDGNHFWRARVTGTSYVIEKWSNAGARLQMVERAAKWWTQPLENIPPTRRPGGGDIHLESIREDTDGRLWVILQLPRQSYWANRSRPEKVQEGDASDTRPRVSAFYRLLEVIEPGAGRLVFSDSSRASLYAVVTPDIVLCESKEDHEGFRMVRLCKLSLGR